MQIVIHVYASSIKNGWFSDVALSVMQAFPYLYVPCSDFLLKPEQEGNLHIGYCILRCVVLSDCSMTEYKLGGDVNNVYAENSTALCIEFLLLPVLLNSLLCNFLLFICT